MKDNKLIIPYSDDAMKVQKDIITIYLISKVLDEFMGNPENLLVVYELHTYFKVAGYRRHLAVSPIISSPSTG